MNYQIIQDEQALQEFIDWLPDLLPHEQYYMSLLARRKYNPLVGNDRAQLARKTASKEFIIQKIRQMECAVGTYLSKGNPVPQDALALYISINPRDLWKASLLTAKQMLANFENNARHKNPTAEAMSAVQNSCGERYYLMFDIDTKSEETLEKAREICQNHCAIIETRGGYHIHVRQAMAKTLGNKWYLEMKKLADVVGDELSPIPGCTQGGYTPKLIQK